MTLLLVMYVVFGLLLVALSQPLIRRRVPPNGFYGFRVPRTLNNPDLWYPANEYVGRHLQVLGAVFTVVAVVLFFVPGLSVDTYAILCAAVILIGLVIVFILGMRYLQS